MEDLGLLNSKVFVCLVPQSAQSVIVRPLNSGVKVSCVVPAKKFKIKVRKSSSRGQKHKFKKCKIKTPDLLLSIEYSDFPRQFASVSNTQIFAINTSIKDQILATPYLLSNVFKGGDICWGTLPLPCNLRSVYVNYLASPFTDDLTTLTTDPGTPDDSTPIIKNYVKYIKKYRKKFLKKQLYVNMTKVICGPSYWASTQKMDGVLVTSDSRLLLQIPSQYWRKSDGPPYIIASAVFLKNIWNFETNNCRFSIANNDVKTSVKTGFDI